MQAELYAAWQTFRRGKKPSRSIDAFAYYQEQHLFQLAREITDCTYHHGPYRAVVIQEKKRRDLAVASVRDRVVHRMVYDDLIALFNPMFDSDVWSCRPGKGLHKCLRRTQQLLRRYPDATTWRMDVTKFFDSVDHQVLQTCLRRRVKNDRTLWLCDQIIASYQHQEQQGRRRGIPIGNLTSQIFANIYLNELDRYIRHTIKPLAYVRYGDDIVVWCATRQIARQVRYHATDFLAHELALTVNPKNDVIIQGRLPLHFLGHVITRLYTVVDRHTTRSALLKSSPRSIASYKALQLARQPRRELDWLLARQFDNLDFLSD